MSDFGSADRRLLQEGGALADIPPPVPRTLRSRTADAIAMFVVSALSLMLLLYVAYGNARKNFEAMHVDKLVTQGQFIQSAMESYLRPGLPMKQFVGFTLLAEPMAKADPAIETIEAVDKEGNRVFISGEQNLRFKAVEPDAPLRGGAANLRKGVKYHKISMPLRNKFETVGFLRIYVPKEYTDNKVFDHFSPLVKILAALCVVFTLFVFAVGPSRVSRRDRWLAASFAVTFLAATTVVITSLIALYSEGAQARGRALADSLGQRVDDVVNYNLSFDGMEGLDAVFREYRRLNPDVGAVGLTVDGRIIVHTNERLVGKQWASDQSTFEYAVNMSPPGAAKIAEIRVTMAKDIVIGQVLGSVKNFAALFVASAFFATIFMQLANTRQRVLEMARAERVNVRDEPALLLVKPVFFLAVCIEHLSYPFLPQFVQQATFNSGLPVNWSAFPFMAYYLCFALALMPAGRYETRIGPRPLIIGGLALSAVGLLALAFWQDFYQVLIARCVSGVGQGMLFIGVQSYILANVSSDRKTQGASIIVFGFQGGMISGMAIGSLLVTNLQPAGIFYLGAGIAALVMLYSWIAVPRTAPTSTGHATPSSSWDIWREIGQMLRDSHFLKTILLIGVPAKAVLTGVIFFAMPLLLAKHGFTQEDIGQITMVYAGSVIAAGAWAAKVADRSGKTTGMLFWGATISAAGLFLLSLLGSETSNLAATPGAMGFLVLAGVITIGVAHGMINAPVVTHVTEGDLSARLGAGSVAAAYRFIERLGHTLGPILVGQLFAAAGQTAGVFVWIAGGILVFGLLFLVNARPTGEGHLKEGLAR